MSEVSFLSLPGVCLLKNFYAADNRGCFIKTYNAEEFARKIGFTGSFRESYYSESYKGVIRGMHFQAPPFDHDKLVYVTKGKILDVILDIRKDSPAYGQYVTAELTANDTSVFIPRGMAHGFLTLSETATVVYNVTTEYNREADQGIRWDSFGFNWPVVSPVVSGRDAGFVKFAAFQSPFL